MGQAMAANGNNAEAASLFRRYLAATPESPYRDVVRSLLRRAQAAAEDSTDLSDPIDCEKIASPSTPTEDSADAPLPLTGSIVGLGGRDGPLPVVPTPPPLAAAPTPTSGADLRASSDDHPAKPVYQRSDFWIMVTLLLAAGVGGVLFIRDNAEHGAR